MRVSKDLRFWVLLNSMLMWAKKELDQFREKRIISRFYRRSFNKGRSRESLKRSSKTRNHQDLQVANNHLNFHKSKTLYQLCQNNKTAPPPICFKRSANNSNQEWECITWESEMQSSKRGNNLTWKKKEKSVKTLVVNSGRTVFAGSKFRMETLSLS